MECNKKEMLLINYEASNGIKCHNRLWNGGTGIGTLKLDKKHDGELNFIDEIKAEYVGGEYGVYDSRSSQHSSSELTTGSHF